MLTAYKKLDKNSHPTVKIADVLIQFGLQFAPFPFQTNAKHFLEAYLDKSMPFGGRAAQIKKLNTWLSDSASRNLLVAAPAGRGKSALLVQWLKDVNRNDWSVVFVPISIRYATNCEADFYAALAAALAGALGVILPPVKGDQAEAFRALAQDYLCELPKKEDKKGCLLVIDGLDEAADGENWKLNTTLLLPPQPNPGLKIVVSACLLAGDRESVGWSQRLGWKVGGFRTIDVPNLDRTGVSDVVVGSLSESLFSGKRRDALINQLMRLTNKGEPILLGLYIMYLLDNAGSPKFRLGDLEKAKSGFDGFYNIWWNYQEELWQKDKRQKPDQQTIDDVLAVLSFAQGPLKFDELTHIMFEIDNKHNIVSKEVLRPVRRFVIGDGEIVGYSFSQSGIAEYFREKFGGEKGHPRKHVEEAFVRFGRTIIKKLNNEEIDSKDQPLSYLFSYYLTHLKRMREHMPSLFPTVFMELVENGWRKARYDCEGGYLGFYNDVARVLAELQTGAGGASIPNLGEQIRCLLCLLSIRSLGTNIPVDRLVEAVENSALTHREALNIMILGYSEEDRTKALWGIAELLDGSVMPAAFGVARRIKDEYLHAMALCALAPRLPNSRKEDVLNEALEAVLKIENEQMLVIALLNIAPYLSCSKVEALGKALEAARKIDNKQWRAMALLYCAQQLADNKLKLEVLKEAREVARRIPEWRVRARVFCDLSWHLSKDEDLELESSTFNMHVRSRY